MDTLHSHHQHAEGRDSEVLWLERSTMQKNQHTKKAMNFSHINIQKISSSFISKRIPFTHVYFGSSIAIV